MTTILKSSGKISPNHTKTEVHKGISNHKQAAKHHEEAAKFHHEAAEHHEAGNHKKAAQSNVKAQGHLIMATRFHAEDSMHHALFGF